MDCSIHLNIASLILGGLYGVEKDLSLPDPVDGKTPDQFTEPMLSASLPEATKIFRESRIAQDLFGAEFVEHYAQLKDMEWDMFCNWANENNDGNTEHNDLNVTQWEYDQYFGWI